MLGIDSFGFLAMNWSISCYDSNYLGTALDRHPCPSAETSGISSGGRNAMGNFVGSNDGCATKLSWLGYG